MSLVNVHNEWDPVEEIIVGTAAHAVMPQQDLGFHAVQKTTPDLFSKLSRGKIPQRIIDETEEDIGTFIAELKKLRIKVKRPEPIAFTGTFKTLDWEAEHFFSYCPRDVLLAIGNTIIETPNVFRSRYFETMSYKKILLDYLKSGATWLAAPKPRLTIESYHFNDQKNKKKSAINNNEPIFDAANILRAGEDIFYLVSDSGNELGCHWLQTTLTEKYRVHACRHLYSSMHIDTTLALLRPGLALINPTRVNEKNLPAPLKKWDIITAPEMVEYQYSVHGNFSTKWLGMNLLMLSPTIAVVDAHQTKLIKMLASRGIDSLPLKLRHGRTLGGGFHCITLDTRRKGRLENYF